MKAIAGIKSVFNKALTKVDNAGLETGNLLKASVSGKPQPLAPFQKFSAKTPTQIGRETIGIKNRAIEAANTPLGGAVDRGIQETIRRPDVVGTAILAETSPLIVGGTTGAAMSAAPLEATIGIVKKHPLLPKSTLGKLDNLANKYSNTGFSNSLRNSKTSLSSIGNSIMSGISKTKLPNVSPSMAMGY